MEICSRQNVTEEEENEKEKEGTVEIKPGVNLIKKFTLVIYKCSHCLRVSKQ